MVHRDVYVANMETKYCLNNKTVKQNTELCINDFRKIIC